MARATEGWANGQTDAIFGGPSSVTIFYEPTMRSPSGENGTPAPPITVLHHELSHAYAIANGTLPRKNDEYQGDGSDKGIKNGERQATGLPMDSKDPKAKPNPTWATENRLRAELGLPIRPTYNEGDGRPVVPPVFTAPRHALTCRM